MIARIVCVAALVSISARRQEPRGDWEKLYELPVGNAWLGAVWADGKDDWMAGGREVLIYNRAKRAEAARVAPIPGLAVTAFGSTSRGVFGVGSHGAIWKITAHDVHLEHQARPTEQRRLRDPDQLLQIGDAEVAGAPGVLAVGMRAVFSARTGEWANIADKAGAKLANELLFGQWFSRPEGCDSITWLVSPRSHREGVLVCGDRRIFEVRDHHMNPLPPLPKACREVWHAAGGARWGTTILCGGKGLVWKQAGPAAWSQVPAPVGVDNIAATESCIFAVSKRSLWRLCEAEPPPTPDASTASDGVDLAPKTPKQAAPRPPPQTGAGGCAARL